MIERPNRREFLIGVSAAAASLLFSRAGFPLDAGSKPFDILVIGDSLVLHAAGAEYGDDLGAVRLVLVSGGPRRVPRSLTRPNWLQVPSQVPLMPPSSVGQTTDYSFTQSDH